MSIGNVIRTYRKKRGLTQAEMAKRLGVTTPAVNKWENNNTLPDIGLLAPIARLLGITTDTLLSFRESLTDEEISLLVKELDRKLETGTYAEAFTFAREKIEEYPDCEKLILNLAVVLDAGTAIYSQNTADSPDTTDFRNKPEETDYNCQIRLWYLRVLESNDYAVQKAAANSLCSLYVREKQYEKAQECLSSFPEDDPGRKRWQALLYSRMDKKEEAYKTYESLMLWAYNNLKMTLNDLRILYMGDRDYTMAHRLVELENGLAALFEMGAYQEVSAGLELAALEKDVEETERIMQVLMERYDTLMDFTRSDLYRHICSGPKSISAFAKRMKEKMAEGFLDEETFGYMHGNAFWEKLKRSGDKN